MLTLGRPTLRAAVACALLAGVLGGLPAASSSATPARSASYSPCVDRTAQSWGPWGHTIAVSGNGKVGAKVTRTLADNMVAGGPLHGEERDEAWTPRTSRLTKAGLRAVRTRHLQAGYFRAVDRRTSQLVTRIRSSVAECPDEALILVGYSQGALELRAALARVARRPDGKGLLDHVGGVLLVGDPGARPGDDVRRYGVQRQRGPVAGARLPRRLTNRDLVASWCRSGDPICSRSRVAAAKGVRLHARYQLAPQGSSAGRRAADRLIAPLTGIALEAGIHWSVPSFVYGESFAGWPVTKPLTGPAAELRLDRARSTVPAGMTLSDDLTLSGTAPTSGTQFDATIALHHARFAPATHRYWESAASIFPTRAGRPGVSLVSHGPGGVRPDGDSYGADVSEDGQTAVFTSEATNLVPGDTDGQANVFVWDRAGDQISKVSDGLGVGRRDQWRRSHVSADGRRITWLSAVDHPALGDTDGKTDAYLYDRDTATTQLASPGTAADVTSATLVADGTRVYFREAVTTGTGTTSDSTVRAWDVGAPSATVLAPPAGGVWMRGDQQGEALVLSANSRYALAHVGDAAVSWDLTGAVAVTSCTGGAVGPGGGGVSDDGTVFAGTWSTVGARVDTMVGLTCDHGASTSAGSSATVPSLTPDGRFLSRVNRVDLGSEVVVTDRTAAATTSAFSGVSAASSLASAASRDALTVVWDATAFNVVETPAAQRGTREIYLWDRTVSP